MAYKASDIGGGAIYRKGQRYEMSLTHLRNEDKWVHWPVQTMRRDKHPNDWDCGLVIAGRTTVFEKNLFDLKSGLIAPQVEDSPHKDYESYEAMLADGWEVD